MMSKIFCTVALCIFLYLGCDIQDALKSPDQQKAEVSQNDALRQILIDQGFCPERIEDHGNAFVVERDIVFYKDRLVSGLSKTTQWAPYYVVSHNKVNNIRVQAHSSLGSAWTTAVNDAITAWNNVGGGCRINLVSVTSNPDITIYSDESPDVPNTCDDHRDIEDYGLIAKGSWPGLDGSPGFIISVNRPDYDYLSAARKKGTIIHELGHCLGFRHTDWQDQGEGFNGNCGLYGAYLIGTTPTTDGSSIMNAVEDPNITELSYYDKVAARQLYPNSLSTPSIVFYECEAIEDLSTITLVSSFDPNAHRMEIWKRNTTYGGLWVLRENVVPPISNYIFQEYDTGTIEYKTRLTNYKGDFTSAYSNVITLTLPCN